MKNNFFGPYFFAISKILKGEPIKDLEKIRLRCNESFYLAGKNKISKRVHSFDKIALQISYFANAENLILLGRKPCDVYKDILSEDMPLDDIRDLGRILLEQEVLAYKSGESFIQKYFPGDIFLGENFLS